MATEIEKAHQLIAGIRFGMRGAFDESPAVGVARRQMDAAKQAAYVAQRAFEDAVRATAFFKQLASMGGVITIHAPTGSLDYGSLQLKPESYGAWGIEQVETKAAWVATLQVDPKTLNALLTGKLLTPEEKRALLKSQGVDLEALVAQPAS